MKRTFCLLATMAFSFSPTIASASTSVKSPAKGLDRKPQSLRLLQLDYIQTYVEEAAAKERLEPALIRAMIRVESNFNHKAVSRVGARGLMQLMPPTANDLGFRQALDHRNPRANILAGARYLRSMINLFQGDLTRAIAAYNAGPGAVNKYNGVPPFRETQAYVVKVLGQLEKERARL